ncbi:G-protein beta WD-40 repeat [Phytophthora cactorum]|nr:G-protein beta WD-40 repeat [Phytophthora cactorum]
MKDIWLLKIQPKAKQHPRRNNDFEALSLHNHDCANGDDSEFPTYCNDKDQFLTLGEVLAFIDSCETSGAIDSDAGDVLLGSGDVSPTDVSMHKTPKTKKRKRRNLKGRDPLSSSTSAGAGGTNAPATSSTQASALSLSSAGTPMLTRSKLRRSPVGRAGRSHYHARLQAEEKNHTLKTILASQVQMGEKVHDTFYCDCIFHGDLIILRFFFVFLQEMDLACIEPPVPHNVSVLETANSMIRFCIQIHVGFAAIPNHEAQTIPAALLPAGIILEYELRDGTREMKEIDLLHLTAESDIEVLVNQIVFEEPLISESRKPQLRRLIYKLIEKLEVNDSNDFYLFKILRAHILPLTNAPSTSPETSKNFSFQACLFSYFLSSFIFVFRFITGSYDRTCKVWDTQTGDELLTLEGHKNVVYAIAFNNPYGDKIITGSFDKTCKLWSAETGQLYHTFRGHSTEIVCLAFNPQGTVIGTGSMDNTAKLWDVETGQELHTLFGHTAEIVSLNFDTQGERIITGSFDHTVKVWDVRSGRCIHTLAGHHGEISSTQFNYTGELCISGSIDRTCKIWDVASGQNVQTLRGHNDEILDVSFNATGSKLVTASADGTSRIYNTMTGACQAILIGHEAEISKVCFNPQGSKVLTASSDKVARLWEVETGDCLQMLEGHTDEIFSCAFNYEGDTIITGTVASSSQSFELKLTT